MKRCVLSWLVILGLLTSLPGVIQARPAPALVHVALPDAESLARFEATGQPAYARLQGDAGDYLLAGADPAGLRSLIAAGLAVRILDADTTGATYYLVYPAPGRPQPRWGDYGRVLLDDGLQMLVRATPQDAARLAEAGAELRLLTLDPKPLRPARAAAAIPTAIQPDPLVQAMLNQVSTTVVYSYTGNLSGKWPVPIGGAPYTIITRHTYSGTPIQKATQYVGEHLAARGLTVEYHTWDASRPPNVIGELPGLIHPDDIYIICAHLDDMPASPPAPGADDNASGSVAVLIAADILTQYQWGCTLRFAFWTGEEQGLLGSRAYAARCYSRGENILGVINLDMIAWNTPASSPDIDLHAKSSLPATLTLAQLFADVVDAYDLNLVPEIIANGTGASDQASFWDYGYTAILGIEDYYPSYHNDFNPRYHTAGDQLQYLDMAYYTDFVKAALATFVHLSGCLIPCEPVHDADFAWQPDPPTAGPVLFTGVASGTAPIAFAWDWGDGFTGTGETISHTYADPGTYHVVMTATNCTDALVTSTHTLVVLCAPITDVELTVMTADPLYTDTLVQFSADIAPDNATKPYTYTIYVDGGAIIPPQAGSNDPLAFSHTFDAAGAHTVEIRAWNCGMTTPVSDTTQVVIARFYLYLPVVVKE